MTYYLKQSDWLNSPEVPEGMNLTMVDDVNRLERLLKVELQKEAKDKIVIDLGAGTGLLGMYALDYGASFIYFVECNAEMCYILENVLPKRINPSKFKIIHKDIEDLTVEDFDQGIPDIAISEFYGPRLFDEGYVNYTKHLRSLFSDIRFIPETFNVDFYLMDLNFRHTIWPLEKKILHHYLFMYKEKGFVNRGVTIDYTGATKVGTLNFNANTQTFDNEFTFKFDEYKAQMIVGHATIHHGDSNQYFTTFGWVLEKEQKGKTFKINVLEENYFNPRKTEI